MLERHRAARLIHVNRCYCAGWQPLCPTVPMHGAEGAGVPITPGEGGALPSTPGCSVVPPSVEGSLGEGAEGKGCDGMDVGAPCIV
jgi:hypothetical protein